MGDKLPLIERISRFSSLLLTFAPLPYIIIAVGELLRDLLPSGPTMNLRVDEVREACVSSGKLHGKVAGASIAR
jgi:hypothetical protein